MKLTEHRVNHLMAATSILPLVLPPGHHIPTSLAQDLGPMPPTVPIRTANSPRTVFFRTVVSLVTGRVSAYIHARTYSLTPDETYESVNATIHDVISMLDGGPPPDTWLNCASYPLLVW